MTALHLAAECGFSLVALGGMMLVAFLLIERGDQILAALGISARRMRDDRNSA